MPLSPLAGGYGVFHGQILALLGALVVRRGTRIPVEREVVQFNGLEDLGDSLFDSPGHSILIHRLKYMYYKL